MALGCLLLVVVFVVLPSVGPLTLADGRTLAMPGLRYEPSRLSMSFSDTVPKVTGVLPVGRRAAALSAFVDGAPLEGGTFVLSAANPADSAYLARWTLWTKFTVNGKSVSESTFIYRVMTGSHVSTPSVSAAHAGVLDTVGIQADAGR